MRNMNFLLPILVMLLPFGQAVGQTTQQYQGILTTESLIQWPKSMLQPSKTEMSATQKGETWKEPTSFIQTTYYIEGTGIYESELSKVGTWGQCLDGKYILGYNCAAIEQIHDQVNTILSQAGIKLVNPGDCPDKIPCVIDSNVPATSALYYRVGDIDLGVNPKYFRDNLSASDKMIESLFLTHGNLLAQGRDRRFSVPGYQAELFIHIVKSVKEHKSAIGLYVPEGYREHYTSQKIKIAGSSYPANANRYIILIGYDDIPTLSGVAETIAHEIGHALGLDHYNVNGNLMTSNGLGNSSLTNSQINTMKNNISYFRNYGGGVSSQKTICVKTK